MLMMTLDDATDVAMKYAKTGYPRDFIRSELELRQCATCRRYLGGGCCAEGLEAECAAGGFEAWERKTGGDEDHA